MNKITDKPVLTALRELKVGESVTYPAKRTSYLRSVCANFGIEWKKKFSTKINRADNTITATRTA